MGLIACMKSMTLGKATIPTITSATTITLDNSSNVFLLSGTATCTSLVCNEAITPGRRVRFLGSSGTTTFTNTDSASTLGQMYLGGANRSIGPSQQLTLEQDNNGIWQIVGNT